MPRVSKIRSAGAGSKPKEAAPIEDERTVFYCSRCGRKHTKQKGNYPASQSSLYKGNGGYLTICNRCIDELFDHYKYALGSDMEAIQRLCLKFDIYWNPEIYSMLYKANTSQSRIRSYISKSNLYKFVGKTYDDTLDELAAAEAERAEAEAEPDDEDEEPAAEEEQETVIPDEAPEEAEEEIFVDDAIVQYWGPGFAPSMYLELEGRKNYWMSRYPSGTILSPGEEGILRQICNLEITINRDIVSGRSIEKSVNAINTLFGSMNMKPSQKKEAEDNYIPFGVEIARFEDEHPIIEPDEDFKDVDKLHRNVIAWFLGSLCKTAGIKNEYSEAYESEMAQYTVERPTFDDETLDDDLSDVDGGDDDG